MYKYIIIFLLILSSLNCQAQRYKTYYAYEDYSFKRKQKEYKSFNYNKKYTLEYLTWKKIIYSKRKRKSGKITYRVRKSIKLF